MQVNTVVPLGQVSDADLRLLRVFKAVADCGGMASAELELNIAMSTISRHIKDLETRVGLVLCRRGRAGFALTPEGEQLYAASEQLLAAAESFRSSLLDIHRRIAGDLHVAFFEKTASNPRARIAESVALFKRNAPRVTLHMHVGTITMIERGVMNGQYHLGIIPEHRRSESLTYAPLFTETMQLYAGKTHHWFKADDTCLDWDSLRGEELAGLGYHSPNMALSHERGLVRAASASDQEGVATLILSGAYVGFLPDHYGDSFVRAGRMRAVAPQVLNYQCVLSCIYRQAPAPLRVAQAFLDALIEMHAPSASDTPAGAGQGSRRLALAGNGD